MPNSYRKPSRMPELKKPTFKPTTPIGIYLIDLFTHFPPPSQDFFLHVEAFVY